MFPRLKVFRGANGQRQCAATAGYPAGCSELRPRQPRTASRTAGCISSDIAPSQPNDWRPDAIVKPAVSRGRAALSNSHRDTMD